MKVLFKTYGCSNNVSESEVMAGLLVRAGHIITESEADAEVVIFNMCSVKGRSVNECLRLAGEYSKTKKVIIAGCVASNLVPRIKSVNSQISVVSTHHIEKIVEVVNESRDLYTFENKVRLNLPKVRKNPLVGIIPILSGCNDSCTYCYTKLIKGNAFSYPSDLIIAEAKKCVADGCKEIWLTSQDNGAYLDGSVRLPELINKIASLDGDFMVRVGMANPNYLLEYLEQFVEAINLPKVYKFVHVPVQSGNNDILKSMARRYFVEDYREIIASLKSKVPDISIATDIICGFPGETDEQFRDTLNLMNETSPDFCFISRFQSRPGTVASKMKQLPGGVIKERSRLLEKAFDTFSLANNQKWRSREFDVLIDEVGKKGESIGKNFAYKQILIKESVPLGKIVRVKVVSASVFHLEAEIV